MSQIVWEKPTERFYYLFILNGWNETYDLFVKLSFNLLSIQYQQNITVEKKNET